MIVAALVALVGLIMHAIERVWPARSLPRVPGFLPRAIAANLVQATVVYLAGLTLDPWLAELRPWSAAGLGPWLGGALGYLAITFVYYWWHRARHQSPFLWRWLHQIHHSPRRLEVLMSFYKHPLEMATNALLTGAVVYLAVGLSPRAAAFASLLTGVAELFYHWNRPTPRWLGYIVQRPESHRVHHQRGRHGHNYADLPIWDILFGTFDNPRGEVECGFSKDNERRVLPMLTGRDLEHPDTHARKGARS